MSRASDKRRHIWRFKRLLSRSICDGGGPREGRGPQHGCGDNSRRSDEAFHRQSPSPIPALFPAPPAHHTPQLDYGCRHHHPISAEWNNNYFKQKGEIFSRIGSYVPLNFARLKNIPAAWRRSFHERPIVRKSLASQVGLSQADSATSSPSPHPARAPDRNSNGNREF